MAQQGKQMRVGARKGSAYHSVKLVSLANGNSWYDVDLNMFFPNGKALSLSIYVLPCPNSGHFNHTLVTVVCARKWFLQAFNSTQNERPKTLLSTYVLSWVYTA